MNEQRLLASYGRKRGRKLRPQHQSVLMQSASVLLGREQIAALSFAEWLQRYSSYHLEIGFGGGEHLAHQAMQHPEVGFIGCEPFINGVAKLLTKLKQQGATDHVRIFQEDAREVLPLLGAIRFSRVYILFPDPWPKTRHHKRRLIQPAFLRWLKPYLSEGATIRVATDHGDYCRHILEVFLSDPNFIWLSRDVNAWSTRFSDAIETRYEAKRLGDIKPVFFEFRFRN